MALVRDDCLVPTLDAPELGYVRESTPEQLVPDVFYKVASRQDSIDRLFTYLSPAPPPLPTHTHTLSCHHTDEE